MPKRVPAAAATPGTSADQVGDVGRHLPAGHEAAGLAGEGGRRPDEHVDAGVAVGEEAVEGLVDGAAEHAGAAGEGAAEHDGDDAQRWRAACAGPAPAASLAASVDDAVSIPRLRLGLAPLGQSAGLDLPGQLAQARLALRRSGRPARRSGPWPAGSTGRRACRRRRADSARRSSTTPRSARSTDALAAATAWGGYERDARPPAGRRRATARRAAGPGSPSRSARR